MTAEEFEALAAEVVEPVRRYLARRTDPETAADVLADTLLVLWRRPDARPPGVSAVAWAIGVARGCLANAERAARRQRRVAGKVARLDPPREVAHPAAGRDEVTEALAMLPPDDAEILRLWAWEELPPREIAAVLGLTPGAASSRLHRAKQKLADLVRTNRGAAGHEGTGGAG